MDKTKVCRYCNIEKPLTDFRPRPRGKLGVDTICRNCDNAIRKAQRIRKPKVSTLGVPRGFVSGELFKAEIDSEIFPSLIYEVKDRTILIKSGKNKIEVKFQYVDAFAKELQEIKNTYFGIRI